MFSPPDLPYTTIFHIFFCYLTQYLCAIGCSLHSQIDVWHCRVFACVWYLWLFRFICSFVRRFPFNVAINRTRWQFELLMHAHRRDTRHTSAVRCHRERARFNPLQILLSRIDIETTGAFRTQFRAAVFLSLSVGYMFRFCYANKSVANPIYSLAHRIIDPLEVRWKLHSGDARLFIY